MAHILHAGGVRADNGSYVSHALCHGCPQPPGPELADRPPALEALQAGPGGWEALVGGQTEAGVTQVAGILPHGGSEWRGLLSLVNGLGRLDDLLQELQGGSLLLPVVGVDWGVVLVKHMLNHMLDGSLTICLSVCLLHV